MRLCNSRLPEEHFVCYQTSQRNWVIIKVLYRCLRWYLLSWHRSRLGFVTLIVGEVSLGPLGNAHHISLASITTNELLPPSGFIRPLSITSMSPFIRPRIGKVHACNHFIGCIKSYCCWCHGWKVNTLHVCFFIGCMHVRECIGSEMKELMWANYYVSWSKRSCL